MMVQHPVQDLLNELTEGTERTAFPELVRQLQRRFAEGEPGPSAVSLSGLTPTARTLYAALLQQALRKPLLYVVRSNRDADHALDLLRTWTDFLGQPAPVFLPAHDIRPYQGLSPHADINEKRALALGKLASRQASLVVLPVAAATGRLQSPEFYRSLALQIQRHQELDLELLREHLETVGYMPRDPVEMAGQFSQRGGILDIFSPEARRPVRLELFGDEVESIREFDVNTQRSVAPLESATILPLTEYPLERRLLEEIATRIGEPSQDYSGSVQPFAGWEFLVPLLRPLSHTLLDLCPDAVLFLDEPSDLQGEIERQWEMLEAEFEQIRQQERPAASPDRFYLRWEEWLQHGSSRPVVHARELDLAAPSGSSEARFHFQTQPAPRFYGNLPLCLAELRNLLEQQYRVLLLTTGPGESERLAELFAEQRIPFHLAERPGGGERAFVAAGSGDSAVAACWISKGGAARGVLFPDQRIAILGNQDVFESVVEAAPRPSAARPKLSIFLSDFRDLQPGDYVVHMDHGIGCYRGLKEIVHDGMTNEFMELEYLGGDRLYVPLTRLDLIQKYRALDQARPALDKLGGVTWARTKARVRKSTQEMAEELLELYAERKLAPGLAFAGDTQWQREFEEQFEFEETPDQRTAIEDVRRDMEKPEPMERLVCGDVGYGKTEVAMRAAFRAATHNKQVAVLAPTTVLALQHYETFRARFAAFPLRIEMLSRFRTAAQQKAILLDLEAGKVDIVIGTHRLLSKDVAFHDLGLVIVDEEQRFGVRHKERLKALKKSVDVLSLSATPIPRTLHMALAGLRDMSVIETPPKDRLAIQTVVAPFSEQLIRTAIGQELERGGQVYFVHNRIETLYSMAALVQRLVPQARVAAAHGQMGERQLERVMLGFLRNETNVLVATTLIENGLDIPLVNTILINRANHLGLAELYQLRGRVGRSNRRAYAYLLVAEDAELTPLARRRLSALKEFSELGSGFRVAALDMELRGAGNLLGAQQHGHVNAVGFEMYCQMMEQAVQQLRGEAVAPRLPAALHLGVDIRIPASYIAEEHQRLRMYKTIGAIRSLEDRARAEQELEDRYGPPPPPVRNLLDYATLKSLAEALGIQAVERKNQAIHIQFHPHTPVNAERLLSFISTRPGVQFTPGGVLQIPLRGKSELLLPQVEAVLHQLQA